MRGCFGEGDLGTTSSIQCAEALFEQIANEETLSAESVGLVVALVFLDLVVTEDQVAEATREVLPPTETGFTEDAPLRFVEHSRPELSATEGSRQPPVADSVCAEPLSPTQW